MMNRANERGEMKLTQRQIEVLKRLAAIKDNRYTNSRDLTSEVFAPEVRGYWAAPMDFGGTNGSHHSATATQLAKLGLVERYKNGRINTFNSRNKSSCCYRISAAGLAALEESKEPQP